MLSQAVEDYLKTIYKLQGGGDDRVNTTAIAQALSVSSASVSNMIKKLTRMELVEHTSYRGVTLTDAGRKVALEIIRHHRLLETYLKEIMGYSWQEMHDEAEQLEHHISEEFEARIDRMLGHPTHDPHGHPIPSIDGEVVEHQTVPLTEADADMPTIVRHVSDEDADLLEYLEQMGLLPNARVRIKDRAPFNGPLTLDVAGRECLVGYEIARNVFVEGP